MPKIYIVGYVGSGKTTLAKRLARELNTTHYELDLVTWEHNSNGNDRKRNKEEIEILFNEIINNDNWIIENVGKDVYEKGYDKADTIIYLNLSKHVLYTRIFKRWIKQNLKIESSPTKPTIKVLKQMIIWGKKELNNSKLSKLKNYKDKFIILNRKTMKKYKYK